MSKRTWHKGPPPHVGWWNASTDRRPEMWRWWDGVRWSWVANSNLASAESAAFSASKQAPKAAVIQWSDYYPKNARVPRIDPRKTK